MTDSTGSTTFCQAQTSQTKPNQDRHQIAGTLTSQFRYGPDGQRYSQRMQPGTVIRDTRYEGPYERAG